MVRRMLDCSSRDGDIPGGSVDDRLSPDTLIASCSAGVSLSNRSRSAFMSPMTLLR